MGLGGETGGAQHPPCLRFVEPQTKMRVVPAHLAERENGIKQAKRYKVR